MVVEASKLCGEHIGRLVKSKSYRTSVDDPSVLEIEWVDRPITMITHKKNGDVNIRVGQRDHRLKSNSVITLED